MPRLAVLITGILAMACISHAAESRDLLTDPAAWKTIASDGVRVTASPEKSPAGATSLRIDYDFSAGAGYGGAYLELPIDLPENYELPLRLRGEGPANNLEIKLVSPDLLDVWWINRRAYEWPTAPMRLANQKRHFQFAWGPGGGKPLTKLGRIELIIAANEGGKGTVWIDDLRFNALPVTRPYTGTPTLSASSTAQPVAPLESLLADAGAAVPWTPAPGDAAPSLTIDFAQPRDLGGLVVHHAATDAASGPFDVEISNDGSSWTSIRAVAGGIRLPAEIMLPDTQTRFIRLSFKPTQPRTEIAVSRIEVLPTEAAVSANAFWKLRATRAPRGTFPRTLLNEQSFWTVIGQPNDDAEALINQEGQIEVDRLSFSLEPFLLPEGGKLLTWAEGQHEQSLREGWMPIPTVTRRHENLELKITTFASGVGGASVLNAAYTVRNTGDQPARGKLLVAIRPIQVLPPWQDLNITGGWTAVRSVRIDSGGLTVNEQKNPKRVIPSGKWNAGAFAYDDGDPVALLRAGRRSAVSKSRDHVDCPQKSASAVIEWAYDLAPGASSTLPLAVPFHSIEPAKDAPVTGEQFHALADAVAQDWASRIENVQFHLPPVARQFSDTIKATQAYILINHDGRGFQPGSRTYNRSWMRDGTMTGAAMLELGHDQLVKEFIDWIAPYQFPSGKVPCVVDRRGADPVPENDSHGQYLWMFANYHRYTGDTELIKKHWPRIKLAVSYIQQIRSERMTGEFSQNAPPRQEPGKPPVPAVAFRGLVPQSISHEGYSAKPMHSYWDQLFILRGLQDAPYLANVAGEPALASTWQQLADDFRQSVIDSIRAAQQAHGIDYLPGCVELGDFDSTSSTILLWPVEESANFPREWVNATFDRYWSEFQRRKGSVTWDAYTPYELRHVNALVRLGRKDRATEVLEWYFSHQRPAGWRHWAEVVWREPNTPRMIGDMPHTWCGSDFLNAARTMFLYEERAQNRLVLFAGVPDEWFTDPAGVGFANLRTEYGSLTATATPNGDGLTIRIEGEAKPAGGFEVVLPAKFARGKATVNGGAVEMRNGRIQVGALPAALEVR